MGWMPEDSQSRETKPTWDYKEGMVFATVLADTSRDFGLLVGELDPTKSWNTPLAVWVHEFKAPNGKFSTVICDKWNEACPFCYENEKYKLQNPMYKNTGGRLPFGLSKKALVPTWDFQEKRVLFFLAGKKIQDGMDFILSRMAHMYKGVVTITRTGKGLQTGYRVDVSTKELTPDIIALIKAQMMDLNTTITKMKLTHKEIFDKSGIHPVTYWASIVKNGNMLDISGWGKMPDISQVSMVTQQSLPTESPVINNSVVLSPEVLSALNTICTVGIYTNKTMVDIIRETGKPYIQYLANAGTDVEKKAVAILLANWDSIK